VLVDIVVVPVVLETLQTPPTHGAEHCPGAATPPLIPSQVRLYAPLAIVTVDACPATHNDEDTGCDETGVVLILH
jgi:hypothetical protein